MVKLRERGAFVVQAGQTGDPYIRGAYALQGLTNPEQAIAIAGKSDMVITVDNFLMHAAQLTGTPAIVLWGPTDKSVYGYDGHEHIEAPHDCTVEVCLGASAPDNYARSCPSETGHCMDKIPISHVLEMYEKLVERRGPWTRRK